MNTFILSTLTGTNVNKPDQVINQGWHGSQPFMTGCLINTRNVYSICSGIVIDVGIDDKNDLYSITVEYNSVVWVRYCLINKCDVSIGDSVLLGTKIGTPYKKLLRFEYCIKDRSDFPVRIGTKQLYKHDPTPVLFGQELLPEVS